MKKIIVSAFLLLMTASMNAQIMRAEELEKYAVEKYGDKWTEAAENLGKQLSLDKNNSLTYEQVIECGDQTKEQLYIALNYWFTATFNNADEVIQLNDKESGVIIGKGFVTDIAAHAGGMNSYIFSINPIIRVDIKDHKIRVTYTVQNYNVFKYIGGGIMGAVSGAQPTRSVEKWALDKCFPFAAKDAYKAKKNSSKALVMTHAYSNVIIDKIEEAAKHGLVGNENEDW